MSRVARMTPQEFEQEVERHVRALHDMGMPWEVIEYNDCVKVETTLPCGCPISEIFKRHGAD